MFHQPVTTGGWIMEAMMTSERISHLVYMTGYQSVIATTLALSVSMKSTLKMEMMQTAARLLSHLKV